MPVPTVLQRQGQQLCRTDLRQNLLLTPPRKSPRGTFSCALLTQWLLSVPWAAGGQCSGGKGCQSPLLTSARWALGRTKRPGCHHPWSCSWLGTRSHSQRAGFGLGAGAKRILLPPNELLTNVLGVPGISEHGAKRLLAGLQGRSQHPVLPGTGLPIQPNPPDGWETSAAPAPPAVTSGRAAAVPGVPLSKLLCGGIEPSGQLGVRNGLQVFLSAKEKGRHFERLCHYPPGQ